MIRGFVFIGIALALSVTLPRSCNAGAATNETVKIDGKSYRVTVKSGIVKVKNKAFISGQTVEDRARMILAVRQVTGCEIYDPFWQDAALLGKLKCE